jgi:DNA repair exonuclease SbcCD ATPase subunit
VRIHVAFVALLTAGLLGLGLPSSASAEAPAAGDTGSAQAPSPVSEFNKQLADVKKSVEDINTEIDKSAKEIEGLSKPEAAVAEIEKLQAIVAAGLAAVADNGDAAKLGARALGFARDKQKQFETDTKFKPEEREMLQREWRRIGDETEKATRDLSAARTEFAQLLRTVQTRSDFIAELQAINNAQRMLEVIRQLAGDIRNASNNVRGFIRNVVPPGT